MIENILDGIEVRLGIDYLQDKENWNCIAKNIVYTGPIDAFYNYSLGALEYRSVRFETEVLDIPNFQGNAAVNYTDKETPWTRIIEHKWFEFGKDEDGNYRSKIPIFGGKSAWNLSYNEYKYLVWMADEGLFTKNSIFFLKLEFAK